MPNQRALVTGGAGFIGSHLTDALLARGYDVTVFDCLAPQVHGADRQPPAYLDPRARLIVADVRDRAALASAVADADVVLHEAAFVGVGQSMYDIVEYVDVNVRGTAMLCEVLARGGHRVRKVLVASSMSNYGEGLYDCAAHGPQTPVPRPLAQLARHAWEPVCPTCEAPLTPRPTPEAAAMRPMSVYATTKRDQEELVLNVCRAYDIPAVALRYFNVYGPRQSLANPYTGVAAIFASRILNGQPPLIFEDGRQSRDFTHVRDIVQANVLALESSAADGAVLNVGTGRSTSLLQLASVLLAHCGLQDRLAPTVLSRFREGDIRHCYADISRIRALLGYEPSVSLEQGAADLTAWAASQPPPPDRAADALTALEQHRLLR